MLLVAMELLIKNFDNTGLDILQSELRKISSKVQMDIVIQPENIFKKGRRLVVFDMDSTIVDAEVIQDNVTKKSGLGIAFQGKEALNQPQMELLPKTIY